MIPVEESEELKREVLLELSRRGLVNDVNQEDEQGDEQEDDKSFHPLRRSSVFDLLGEYLPNLRRIIVYTGMCRRVSEKIGVPYDELVAVVRLHEEAHAVTHLGRDEDGEIWKHFHLASVEDKELAAQILTFLYCKASDLASLLRTFRALAENQDEPYNTWREYEASSREEIVAFIHQLRRRPPSLIIDYSFYGGGPIGFKRHHINYRIKGTGTLLHILGPRSGLFGPGSSRHDVVGRKAIAAVDSSTEPLRSQILTLLADLLEVYERWPGISTNRLNISDAIIDIIEGLLDLESDHFEFRAFRLSEDHLARLLAVSRKAMTLRRQGSLERYGVMDAPFHQITLYVDGQWKTWWGNVGWEVQVLEELDRTVRRVATECGAGG